MFLFICSCGFAITHEEQQQHETVTPTTTTLDASTGGYVCIASPQNMSSWTLSNLCRCYLAVAYIVAIICMYYYTAAYNTPETQNYDCVSYDIRSNPK